MKSTVANPIRTLRRQATCLEAAIAVNLVKPKKKAVHELRAETRRIEAQLDLLQWVHGLPSYSTQAEKLLTRLGKLRRLAGDVRDCDVQRKILKDEKHELASPAEDAKGLERDRDRLLKAVSKRRKEGEARLVRSLNQQQRKLAKDLESVLDALKPSEDAEANASSLLTSLEQRFQQQLRVRAAGQEHLHELRKAAKRARYQCETIPGAQATALAKQLEEIQDAGGSWHDFLMLAEEAAERLGANHSLTRVLERRRDEHLEEYLRKLEEFRNGQTSAERPEHVAQERRLPQRATEARSTAPAGRRAA